MTDDANEKPGCMSALLRIFGINLQKGEHKGRHPPEFEVTYLPADVHEPLPYRVRDDFLSPSEISFFHVLENIVGEKAIICPKVRLADIFFVAQPNKNVSFFNQISAKHIDFLLCKADSLSPILAIELDDASHTRPNRQERDEFVEQAFNDANLPLLRFPAKRTYSVIDLAGTLNPYFDSLPPTSPELPAVGQISEAPHLAADDPVPTCPKCGLPMVLRTAAQGSNKGKQFYGCANYPRCREIRPYSAQID